MAFHISKTRLTFFFFFVKLSILLKIGWKEQVKVLNNLNRRSNFVKWNPDIASTGYNRNPMLPTLHCNRELLSWGDTGVGAGWASGTRVCCQRRISAEEPSGSFQKSTGHSIYHSSSSPEFVVHHCNPQRENSVKHHRFPLLSLCLCLLPEADPQRCHYNLWFWLSSCFSHLAPVRALSFLRKQFLSSFLYSGRL